MRVSKISQEAKLQVVIPVRQKPNFKRLTQSFNTLSAGEQSRHHNQCAAVWWNSLRKIQTRQQLRRRHQGRYPVDQRDCKMTSAQNYEDRYQCEYPTM